MEERITRGKAIWLKCLDCCCGNSAEVRRCPAESCPLHPFREGHDPFRAKVELTPEQKEKRRQSLAVAREKQRNLQE